MLFGREKQAPWDYFIKALIPFMGIAATGPSHFPKAPISLGFEFLAYESGGDTNLDHCTRSQYTLHRVRNPYKHISGHLTQWLSVENCALLNLS